MSSTLAFLWVAFTNKLDLPSPAAAATLPLSCSLYYQIILITSVALNSYILHFRGHKTDDLCLSQEEEQRKRAIEELTLPEQDKPNITISQTPTAGKNRFRYPQHILKAHSISIIKFTLKAELFNHKLSLRKFTETCCQDIRV